MIRLAPTLLLSLLPAVAFAQNRLPRLDAPQQPAVERPDGQRGAIDTGGNGFSLPAGEVTVGELIQAAAQFLGRNILWNPRDLEGIPGDASFFLQKKTVLDALGCEELVYGLLLTKGLAIVPIDEQRAFYEVIALQGPRGRELFARAPMRTREQVLRRPGFREFCCVAVNLEHINANVAANALRPFFAQSGNNSGAGLTMASVGNESSLIVTGFGDQVAMVLRLLQVADVEQPPDAAAIAAQKKQEQLAEALQRLEATVVELHGKVRRLEQAAARTDKDAAGR